MNNYNYNYNRLNMHNTRGNHYSRTHKRDIINLAFTTAVMITLSIMICFAFTNAIDTHIKNQDQMLCNSAKISGNLEYLEKCQCYYKTNDIECLQK
jgi:hypothetical protein